ncbi:ATP-binding cassette sub-family E member 1 [Silurus asotus]|uniref:ATP-binding cassette sub-family E member 1 n=1 Tax=Silurus asotus TaxID=30991 RepID=A0AAD5A3V0_SILAS|nr:ATP-binding cassette sub-family E member 1 [Silurus asotus]
MEDLFHFLTDGRLYYLGPNKTYMRLVVMTEEEKSFALNECHDNSETGNHLGVRGTRNKVIEGYFWPTLIKDVTDWKSVPVKVLVTHAPAAKDICPSQDLYPVMKEDLQQCNGIPIITTIEETTAPEETKPYFRVVVGNVQTLLDPPLSQQLLGRKSEADVNCIYKRYLLQELEVRKADLQYTKLKIRKLELEIKKMEKEEKCPFGALSIVNLPSNLEKETTHRYCANSFKLHRLPIPRPGEVLGLVGTNGIGKSTALKILAGKQKPNLGKYDAPPDWQEILAYFRGSELQNYFTKILEDDLKAIVKPQYVDQIPKTVKIITYCSVKDSKPRPHVYDLYVGEGLAILIFKRALLCCDWSDLLHLRDRNVEDLSGGELQRFACAVVCIQRADIFMFDEPSSYLDVKQRLRAAITIRSLISPDRYIIVVEHDLSVLDYLSDFICCLYGVPSAYGVVTMPFSVREGINIFLDGYVPTENLRFRETSLVFKVAETAAEEEVKKMCRYQYPNMCKSMGDFTLTITEGEFTDSEIMVMLGENGDVPILNVSYKPQKISPKFKGSVRALLHDKIRDAYTHPQFVTDVMKPMQIESIIDQDATPSPDVRHHPGRNTAYFSTPTPPFTSAGPINDSLFIVLSLRFIILFTDRIAERRTGNEPGGHHVFHMSSPCGRGR